MLGSDAVALYRRDRATRRCDDSLVTYDITPEQASHGRTVAERELPMLAAQWLVDGYDSPLLRELASLAEREVLDARVSFGDVLAELGFPVRQS